MTIDLAFPADTRRPGIGLKLNLKSGPISIGGGAIRALIISTKNATGGSATVDTVLYPDVGSADAVSTLAGPGGLAHDAASRFFEENPTGTLDMAFMADAAGNSATGTFTFDDASPIIVQQQVNVQIAGRTFSIPWSVGVSKVDIATALVTKIANLSNILPVTAANGGGALAVVTNTFKQKGTAGIDCAISISLSGGAGGSAVASGAKLTGGTTEASNANVIANLMPGHEWRAIVQCLSNTDCAIASPTSNLGRMKVYIGGSNSGIGALLETNISACTDSTTNAKAMAAQHDYEYFNHTLWRGAQSLPCEIAAWGAGIYTREIKDDPNHPFINEEAGPKATLYGSPNASADNLSAVEAEDLLHFGVSYVTLNAQGVPRLARPISTYYLDSNANPDDRVLDFSKVFGMMAVASALRIFLGRQFAGKKLAKSLPTGNTPIPPNIVQEKTAKNMVIGFIRDQYVAAGVVDGAKLDASVADGSLVVQVNPSVATQLDMFLPLGIIPPLVNTSIVIVQA